MQYQNYNQNSHQVRLVKEQIAVAKFSLKYS